MVDEAGREDLELARRLRLRGLVDRSDYLRALRRAAGSVSQVELARVLGVKQPSVHSSLKSAAKVADVVPGFCGASGYEIAQRYAAGLISQEQLLDELARFPYVKGPVTDGFDSFLPDAAGTFEDVVKAFDEGLISAQEYDAVLEASQGERVDTTSLGGQSLGS